MSSRQAEQFETEEVSERQKTSSQAHYGATRAKAVLHSIINHEHNAIGQVDKTEEEEKFQQTPEASTFHIIPENSLEISNSNKNSNTLDETKQFKEVVAPIKLADNQPLKLMDQFQSYNTQTGQNSNITTGKAVHEDCRQVIQTRRTAQAMHFSENSIQFGNGVIKNSGTESLTRDYERSNEENKE